MMLTIYGLPKSTKYKNVKSLIYQLCQLTDCILDKLVADGNFMSVKVGVANEAEGAMLLRRMNGYMMNDHRLRVEPVGNTMVSTSQQSANFQPGRNDFQSQSSYEQPNNYQPRHEFQQNFNQPRNDYPGNNYQPVHSGPAHDPWNPVNQWGNKQINTPTTVPFQQEQVPFQQQQYQQSAPFQQQNAPANFGPKDPIHHRFPPRDQRDAQVDSRMPQSHTAFSSRNASVGLGDAAQRRPTAPQGYAIHDKSLEIAKETLQGRGAPFGGGLNSPWAQSTSTQKPQDFRARFPDPDPAGYPRRDDRDDKRLFRDPAPGRKDIHPRNLEDPGRNHPMAGRKDDYPRRDDMRGRREESPRGGPRRDDVPYRRDDLVPRRDGVMPRRDEVMQKRDDMAPRRDGPMPGRDNVMQRRDNVGPRNDMGPRRDDMVPRRDDMAPRRDDMGPRRDDMAPRRDDMAPRRDDMGPRRDNIPPRRDNVVPGRDDIMPRRDEMMAKRDTKKRDSRSPRRFSPGPRSPVRRPPSPGRLNRGHERYSPSHSFEGRFPPDQRKQVRPAYEPPTHSAPKQCNTLGGYHPNRNENIQYPGHHQPANWQGDYQSKDDRPYQKHFDNDRNDRLRRSKERQSHSSFDRSPKERFVNHSPSRSPRRSWANEKRRSPKPFDAPPPPSWPLQKNYEYQNAQMWNADGKKDSNDDHRGWKDRPEQSFDQQSKPLSDNRGGRGERPMRENRDFSEREIQDHKDFLDEMDRRHGPKADPIKESKAQRALAVAKIVERITKRYELTRKAKEELQLELSKKINKMFGLQIVSHNTILVKFENIYSNQDEDRILQEVTASLPSRDRPKKITGETSTLEAAKTTDDFEKMRNKNIFKEQLKEKYKQTIEEVRNRMLAAHNLRPGAENFKRICEELNMVLLRILLRFGEQYGPACDIKRRFYQAYNSADESKMLDEIREKVSQESRKRAMPDTSSMVPEKVARHSGADMNVTDFKRNQRSTNATSPTPEPKKPVAKKENLPTAIAAPLPQRLQRERLIAKPIVNKQALKPETLTKAANTSQTITQSFGSNGALPKKVITKKVLSKFKKAAMVSNKVATAAKVVPAAKVVAKITPMPKVAKAPVRKPITPTKVIQKVTPVKVDPPKISEVEVPANDIADAAKDVKPEVEKAIEVKEEDTQKDTADTDIENGLPLAEALAIEQEVCDVMDAVWGVLPSNPTADAEQLVVNRLKGAIGTDISEVLAMTLASRLLDVHNDIYVKVSLTPPPTPVQLAAFCRAARVWKRRAVGGGRYVAQLRRWRDLDRLCALAEYDGMKVIATPAYDFTTFPKELNDENAQQKDSYEDKSTIVPDTKKENMSDETVVAEETKPVEESLTVDENSVVKTEQSQVKNVVVAKADVNINDLLQEGIVLDECVGSEDDLH